MPKAVALTRSHHLRRLPEPGGVEQVSEPDVTPLHRNVGLHEVVALVELCHLLFVQLLSSSRHSLDVDHLGKLGAVDEAVGNYGVSGRGRGRKVIFEVSQVFQWDGQLSHLVGQLYVEFAQSVGGDFLGSLRPSFYRFRCCK